MGLRPLITENEIQIENGLVASFGMPEERQERTSVLQTRLKASEIRQVSALNSLERADSSLGVLFSPCLSN